MNFEKYMRRAIELARYAIGETFPNPIVGAVIVENEEVVAEGWHKKAGTPHAEINALNNFSTPASLSTILFVTLEPCSTCGRTGACTDAIIKSGIKKVVVGTTDPNPVHAGRGLEILKNAGIEVVSGVLEKECRELNLIFNHYIQFKTPFLAMKTAMTLDGKIATRYGESKWITNELSRKNVMSQRKAFQAIAIGSGTALSDNPSLTARFDGDVIFSPIRFIFDRSLKTFEKINELSVYNDAFFDKTIVVCNKDLFIEKQNLFLKKGIKIWALPATTDKDFWSAFQLALIENNIYSVYFEAGSKLAGALLNAKILNHIFIYYAMKIMGDSSAKSAFDGPSLEHLSDIVKLELPFVKHFGDDLFVSAKFKL